MRITPDKHLIILLIFALVTAFAIWTLLAPTAYYY